MTFVTLSPNPHLRLVPGVGPPHAKIAIIGEAPGAYEDARLKPFVGPAGTVLEQCLHAAGLIRADIYLTNVVKVRPRNNDIMPFFTGRGFTAEGQEWQQKLLAELNEVDANVIVACGKTALCALTGETAITKFRGYVLDSVGLARPTKIIPCIHPAAVTYDRKGGDKGSLTTKEFRPHIYRYVITADLKKAKLLSDSPELARPDRQIICEFANVGEVLEWLEYYNSQPQVSFDIEVINYEVSCISFSSDPSIALSVPIAGGRWSESEECLIWRGIQQVLGNPKIVKIGQNLIFDNHFLLTRNGIVVRGVLHDTMIGHSIVFPELPKGLGFLGSIYCGTQAYWKDMVKFKNIKEES